MKEPRQKTRKRTSPNQESLHRRPNRARETSATSEASDANHPSEALLDGRAGESTFELHAAFLSGSRLFHPANSREKSRFVRKLQSDYGNKYVQRLVKHISETRSVAAQSKLTVGPAGDKYEREADSVAKRVVNVTKPTAQRNGEEIDEERIQLKDISQGRIGSEGGDVVPDMEQAIQVSRGRGEALPDDFRSSMESAFDTDFSAVRVHSDAESDSLNKNLSARAFTAGQDIFFAKGEYKPSITSGKEVLAHELTHVIQQGSAEQVSPVHRHPEHAEEQEVQAKRIRRHPEHAEEQEVQAKHIQGRRELTEEHEDVSPRQWSLAALAPKMKNAAASEGSTLQRLAVGKDEKDQTAVYSVRQVLKKLNTDYKFIKTKTLSKRLRELHDGNVVFSSWKDLDEKLRGEGHLLKHQDKKLALEVKFGIPIGGESGIEQFGEKMLATLDKLFSHLPPSHLSALKGITRQKEDTASFYDPSNQTLTISYAQPAWLYTWGKKNTKLFGKDARSLMEDAAMPVMMQGSSYQKSGDEDLGLDTKERSTISSSRKDAFANTRIVEWTVLHEIGHAVDDTIKWTTRNGGNAAFGGWITHGDRQDPKVKEEIAEIYLKDAGYSLGELESIQTSLGDDDINAIKMRILLLKEDVKQLQSYIDKGKSVYEKPKKKKDQQILDEEAKFGNTRTGKVAFMSAFLGTDLKAKKAAAENIVSGLGEEERPSAQQKIAKALEGIAYTQAVPWQFPDGLASKIEVDGRIYQLNHYGTWVSYLASARANKLSPYQFSSPGEWIAEAYAAFYGTNAKAKNLLTSETKEKIQEELGAAPRKGKSEEDREKGSLESIVSDKALLSAPQEEEVELIEIVVSEDDYSEDEFDQDYSVIVGGYKEPSPLESALKQDENISAL